MRSSDASVAAFDMVGLDMVGFRAVWGLSLRILSPTKKSAKNPASLVLSRVSGLPIPDATAKKVFAFSTKNEHKRSGSGLFFQLISGKKAPCGGL